MASKHIHQVLLAVIYLIATLLSSSCNALSVLQCNRRRIGYFRSKVTINNDALFLANNARHDVKSSSKVEIPRIGKHLLHRIHPMYYSLKDIADDGADKKHNEIANYNLMHSIALIATCRRISFLALSIILVNFVRNTILKVSHTNLLRCTTTYSY